MMRETHEEGIAVSVGLQHEAPEVKLPERYEVVNGQIVEIPPMSFYACEVANLLNDAFCRYRISNDLGRSRVEMQFRLPLPEDPDRCRVPDVVFVSYERWPRQQKLPLRGQAFDVVPDLAVEVLSPNDVAVLMLAKVREYLRAGVRLVWLIYPETQEVHAYDPQGQVKVFLNTDHLTCEEILPGFRLPVATLFPEPTEPPPIPED